METKKKFNPVILILSIVSVALLGLSIFLWLGKSRAEKETQEIQSKYDALMSQNAKTELELEETKTQYNDLVETINAALQTAEVYQNAYNQLVSYMLDDAVLAENLGNLTIRVWSNAILQTSDSETDKYTKKNGKFVSDFNDALSNLFNDKDFSEKMNELSSRQDEIREMMKDMLNPSEGFDNAFKALESLYNSYIVFTNIVLRCDGSLKSYSDDFSSADTDFSQKYSAAELYVK